MGKGGKNKGKGGAKVVKATPQPAWKSDENIDKYSKGTANVSVKNIKHKSLRKTLEETRDRNKTAAINTAATEILLPADSGFIEVDSKEKVFQIKQRELVHNVDLNTAKNRIDFQLTKFGPYNIDFSRNGR